MGTKTCAVIGCKHTYKSKVPFFTVKNEWFVLNHVGWKKHKIKYICHSHFKEEDIIKNNVKSLLRLGAQPLYFREESVHTR